MATFIPVNYTIIPVALGNGAIDPPAQVQVSYGGGVTFTATPNAGNQVAAWSVDGIPVQTGGTTFILNNITANHNVVVTFSTLPASYIITPSADSHGGISPSSPQTVSVGSTLSFVAVPDT